METKISIIIASYFKSQLLDLGLCSLSNQIINFPYEILVLNDGIVDDTESICNKYKDQLNIRYIFTGQRNLDAPTWRGIGATLNEGVKLAEGNLIILSSPEIFHIDNHNITNLITPLCKNPKLITIPEGKDDSGNFLHHLRIDNNLKNMDYSLYDKLPDKLNTKLPFCIGMRKERFLSMNGFDSRFSGGYCFDDNDFADRLISEGGEYCLVDAKIVHLYHSRNTKDRKGLTDKQKILYRKNEQLYLEQVKLRNQKLTSESEKINPVSPIIQLEKKIEYQNRWHLEKIPKIVHFYWGEKTLPYLRYLTIESFIEYNPDWEVRFYYPKYPQIHKSWNTHEHKYDIHLTKDYYEELKQLPIKTIEVDFALINIDNNLSEVHKSDYLRWYLLSSIGGLWSDMDIIFIDSMNHLITLNTENNKEIDTIVCYHLPWLHSIGFLLSSKNNEYYKILWETALNYKYDRYNYQTVGSLLINSSMKKQDLNSLQFRFPNLKIDNLPMNSVYPYTTHLLKIMYDSKNTTYITEGTIGVHWYAGHPRVGEFVSIINKENYKTVNNIISETIDMALLKTKQEIIKFNRAWNFTKKYNKKELTIHSVVKNEPFIYYSIKSIYDYADKILLYDTGSDDVHTLEDIQQLLLEDNKHKITFKQISLDFDETKWTFEHVNEFAKDHKGLMSVGRVRQMQIDDTTTEFCMLVDGDEVHYKETMNKIVNEILPYLNEHIIGVNIPLIWFYDMKRVFRVAGLENTGRIWRTNKVIMNDVSPNEAHCFKDTKIPISITDEEYLIYKDLIPYAHFETLLKPWRRKIDINQLSFFKDTLPEVINEYPYYLERFLKERENKNG